MFKNECAHLGTNCPTIPTVPYLRPEFDSGSRPSIIYILTDFRQDDGVGRGLAVCRKPESHTDDVVVRCSVEVKDRRGSCVGKCVHTSLVIRAFPPVLSGLGQRGLFSAEIF